MGRRIAFALAFACLWAGVLGVAPAANAAAPAVGPARDAGDTWTIALYVNADNDLDYLWPRFTLPALRRIPASSQVNVVALVDRESETGSFLYRIRGSQVTTVRHWITERDFGQGETFQWFLRQMHSRFPVDHLIVVGWDHGYGWRYFSHDYNADDAITMPELRAALSGAGVPVDVLAFDACNMGDVDVAYEAALTHLVKIMVASEESVSANGYPYDKMLAPLADDPSLTPVQVAQAMVAGWKDYYDGLNWANTAQLAAVDVTRIAAAAPDLRAWARRLAADLPLYKKAYTRELKKTWHAWASNQYDFSDYCAKLIEDTQVKDATLKALTRTVKNDLADATIANATAPKSVPVTALTIWWDEHVDWKTWQADYLAHVSFAQPAPLGMGWWAFLNAYNQ